MRLSHFEALRPVCPRCRRDGHGVAELALGDVSRGDDASVLEGFLRCPAGHLFPVLDGIPILVADVESVVRNQIQTLTARTDLPPDMANFLSACCGSGSAYTTARYHLSIYARDHYGDFDPADAEEPAAGSVRGLLAAGLGALPEAPRAPALDVGCSVGRTSFDLAASVGGPVLGVDLSFSMLRLAQDVLRSGRLRYPRRLEGTLYDEREVVVDVLHRERVDFWLCDATDLPWSTGAFRVVSHLNVLDCVPSPYGALQALEEVLEPGGLAVLATPYDWSTSATPLEAWLGGHSQRGPGRGRSDTVLRSLLGGGHPAALAGLEIVAEPEPPDWRLRLDARQSATYRSHLVVLRRVAGPIRSSNL